MRINRLLILLLSFEKAIIASALLIERQEQGAWPDWDFGDLFEDGVTLFRGLGGLFQDPQDSDSSKTKPSPDTDTPSDGKTSPDSPQATPASPPSPDTPQVAPAPPPSLDIPQVVPASPPSSDTPPAEQYKIEIHNNPSPLPGLGLDGPAAPPSVNEECDPMNINYADCTQTADQLIFTSGCAGIDPNQVVSVEASAQNQAIQERLVIMNNQNILAGKEGRGLRISSLYLCGVFFFAVPLTKKQIQDIEKQPGVRSVRPNQALYMEDVPASFGPEESDPADTPVLTAPGSQPHKRDRVIVDPLAFEDLRFISTPQGQELSPAYFYYSKAGLDVTVIAVDSGANIAHDEFVTATGGSSLLRDRIYAMDSLGLADDYDNFGTCRLSKIVGRTYGVARRAKAMIAMIAPELSSLIDVFVQVANYLNEKSRSGQKVKGYYVMSLMLQWDNTDPEETGLFQELLDILIKRFQLVVVVQAGIDPNYHNSDIIRWPATSERRNDIIVVGAVEVRTGRTYAFSRGGPFLSVNAPGTGKCAQNDAGTASMRRRGTDVATADVVGVIAYLLSLETIGPVLRRDPTMIPLRVKYYIKNVAAYKRLEDDFPAIWNLLGRFS